MLGKIKNIGCNLGIAITVILLYEVASNLVMIVGSCIFSENDYSNHYFMLDTCLVLSLLIVYSVWLHRMHRSEQDTTVMLKSLVDHRMLVAIPIITLGLKGITGVWLIAVEMGLNFIPLIAESVQSHSDTWSAIDTQPNFWVLMSVAVIGPIVEELLFRGIVFHYLEKIKTGWFPIIISGISFGLWHKEPVQCVYAAIIVIAFGIVYAKGRDLKVVIAMHIFNNFLSTLPPMLNTETIQIVITCVSYVMILPAVLILVRMCKKETQEVSVSNA